MQIKDTPSDGDPQLMAVDNSTELACLSLPFSRDREKVRVLRKDDATCRGRPSQEEFIVSLGIVVILGCDDIDSTKFSCSVIAAGTWTSM